MKEIDGGRKKRKKDDGEGGEWNEDERRGNEGR